MQLAFLQKIINRFVIKMRNLYTQKKIDLRSHIYDMLHYNTTLLTYYWKCGL